MDQIRDHWHGEAAFDGYLPVALGRDGQRIGSDQGQHGELHHVANRLRAGVAGARDGAPFVGVAEHVDAGVDQHARRSPAAPPVRLIGEGHERRFRVAAVVQEIKLGGAGSCIHDLHKNRTMRDDLIIPGRCVVPKLRALRDPRIFKYDRGVSLVQKSDEHVANPHEDDQRLRAISQAHCFGSHKERVASGRDRDQGVSPALDPFVKVGRKDAMHAGKVSGRGRQRHVHDHPAGEVPLRLRFRHAQTRPEPVAVGLLQVAEIRELRANPQRGAVLHAVKVQLRVDQIGDPRHQQGRRDGREGQELDVLHGQPIRGPRIPQKRLVGPENPHRRRALVA